MNHLYVCSICQVEIEALAKRRRVEIDTFIKVHVGNGDLGTKAMCSQALGGSVVQSSRGQGRRSLLPAEALAVVKCQCCTWAWAQWFRLSVFIVVALLCLTGALLSLGGGTLLAEDCWALHLVWKVSETQKVGGGWCSVGPRVWPVRKGIAVGGAIPPLIQQDTGWV